MNQSQVDTILPREEYERIVAETFAKATGQPVEDWLEHAKTVVEADLENLDLSRVEYGDPEYCWDEQAARESAMNDMDEWDFAHV